MIYKITDEMKKVHRRRDDDFSGGISNEALMELIRQVESEEMLHAPGQLKNNIFTQLRKEKRAVKKRQVFTYRAKVLAAMAAALTVLIFMPNDRAESVQKTHVQQEESGSLEEIAQERQKNRDDEWEKYLAGQARGGVRGFFDNINEKMTQFGTDLYQNISQ